jgi:photosystem II stability/assembly factor-like uncharacterized protein
MKRLNITSIVLFLGFGLMLGFAACKDDPIEPDPIINDDPDPVITEECFDVNDLDTYFDVIQTVCFINPEEGWLVGQDSDDNTTDILAHTADEGLTWSVVNTDLKVFHTSNVSAPYIDFYNSTDGYMIGEYEYVAGGYGGNPLKYTTNQGQTWTEIADVAYGTWDVVAVNSTDAVFIGHSVYGFDHSSVLYQVSNTTHQITQTVSLPISLEFFAKADMNLSEDGVINVPVSRVDIGPGIYMARSVDFGLTWTYTLIDLKYIYNIDFPTENTGYIIGDVDELDIFLCKTTDGGLTWTNKPLPAGVFFIHHDFFDAQNGLGIINGSIYKTTDGAETWTELTCISDSDHNPTRGVAYVSLDKWYAIGNRYNSAEDETHSEFLIYEED